MTRPARRGRPSAGVSGPVRVGGARLERADGMAAAVLVTGSLDVTALDAEAAAGVTAAFERLCRGLEAPLQIVVQMRPWVDGPGGAPARAEHRPCPAGVMRRRVLVVTTAPAADPAELDRAVQAASAALSAAGIEARRLEGRDLRDCLLEAWGAAHRESAAPWDQVSLVPPEWRSAPTWARSGVVAVRAVRVRRLPGVEVGPGWLAPVLRLRAECDVAIHLCPVGLGDAMGRLGRRLRSLRADQLIEIERDSAGNAGVEIGFEAALELRDRLARNSASPLTLSITAVARAAGVEDLDAPTEALRTALSACLTRSDVAHFEHLEAAACAWPIGLERAAIAKLVDSATAATCLPWVEAVVDDPGGYPLGRGLGTGTPVRLDPFDVGHHSNANVAVLAASGRGKSYAIGGLVLAAAARGAAAVILDPEAEHRAVVEALGGEYLVLRPGCGHSLNLLDAAGGAAAQGEPGGAAAGASAAGADWTTETLGASERRAELAGATVSLTAILCGGLGDVERAVVDAAAMRALERADAEARVPVLGDVLGELGDPTSAAATVLRRFCTGPLGELFNRPTSVRLDRDVVGIALRDVRDELVPAATFIVAEWLWALVRRDRRKRHIVVDEVGLLCAHAPLRTLLAQLARRCRKYGASLVIATQNAGDLLATDEGRVMATNPSIVLLGGHRGAETELMQRAYALTDAQRGQLDAAARGEFLLLSGRRRLLMRVELPEAHHALLTGGRLETAGRRG